MHKLTVFLAMFIMAVGFKATAAPVTTAKTADEQTRLRYVDSLEQRLANEPGGSRRVAILYDLYDLSAADRRYDAAERLYQQAVAAGDTAARFDALRLLANAARTDSLIAIQQRRAELMPVTADQKETLTFIRIARARRAANTLKGQDRMDSLHDALTVYGDDNKVDIYRRVEMLATICMYLTERANDKLVMDYIAELEKLIDLLPEGSGSLRSTLLLYTAMATSRSMRHEDAIKSEKKLMEQIQALRDKHLAEGREFTNYDEHYFWIYTRMLMNYKALTLPEVDSLYARIRELGRHNADIADDQQKRDIAKAYWNLAHGNYAVAARLLDHEAEYPRNQSRRFLLLTSLIEAAEAAGDSQLALSAYRRYIPMMHERNMALDGDRVIEYQILHELTNLQTANADLSAQKHLAELNSRTKIVNIVVWALIAMVILLIVTYIAYQRAQHLSSRLKDTLTQLTTERDTLKDTQGKLIAARDKARKADRQKTDFINAISHEITEPANAIMGYTQLIVDSIDGKRRASMENFIRIIELNSQLLKTLVNDVLDVAELENSQIVFKYQHIEALTLCQVAVDSLRERLGDKQTVSIHAVPGTDPKAVVSVDASRVGQVLVNMLSNAIKFTDEGHIDVTYGVDHDANRATFIVQDNGPGIPDGKEEIIFQRFERLGTFKQGLGLGLYICRMLAKMMNGTIEVDKTYRQGARFVFTIPVTPDGSVGSTIQKID